MRLPSPIFAALFASGVWAASPFYLGTWKIVSAQTAPWWDSSGKPDDAESKGLVGKTVVIKAEGIAGPRELACKGPRYKVRNDTAEMLFQGAFDEMRRRKASVVPAKVAAGLGFQGTTWKTLETGCANEMEYHFLDATTAELGLNNFVYVLKKQ